MVYAAMSYEEYETDVLHWCFSENMRAPQRTFIRRTHKALRENYAKSEYIRITQKIGNEGQRELLASVRGDSIAPSIIDLRDEPGKTNRKNFRAIARKLSFIESLELPHRYIEKLDPKFLEMESRRIAKLKPAEIRRFSREKQISLLSVYLVTHQPTMTDTFVDMLIEAVHKIRTKSEREVGRMVARQARQICDAEAALISLLKIGKETPEKPIGEAIAEIMSVPTMDAFLAQKSEKVPYAKSVFTLMHNRWKIHYRSMLQTLLQTVDFCSNTDEILPLLAALDWIHVNFSVRRPAHYLIDRVPIDGVISDRDRSAIISKDGTVDKYSYELYVVGLLREKLRQRDVWVPGCDKYRNPDEDLPDDYEENRESYYGLLKLGQDGKAFVADLRDQLSSLNDEMPNNPYVSVAWTTKPKFLVSKLLPAVEPKGLIKLKAELGQKWPMTSLIDMLKETAYDTQFLKDMETIGSSQRLDARTLNHRLLLCLYALGTNAGLKRIASATNGVSYEQLLHVRRRCISPDNLRRANARVANAIMAARDPDIWGEMGSACASDSKQYPAWDNNGQAEYHVRYRGWGVMIYWHVDRKSLCVYSKLKSVSSSEVAAMIEGVVKHCTDMDIQRQYTDSHGQTEVAFAFSHLLGFDLAPRIKRIAHMKLYVPDNRFKSRISDLAPMLTRAIDWDLIISRYDEMVKYAAAMKAGTAEPESILRRFTRSGVQHPTYSALQELGRVIKTIFVCRYLRSEALRREINDGLNVVENWNSATRFVLFGKNGEVTSSRLEDREVTVQALHLLQNSMIYVNTHMYQSILSNPELRASMSAEDYKGITPLIYENVNPYGSIELNLDERMEF